MLCMLRVEHPSQLFGQPVRNGENLRNMTHDDVFSVNPVFDAKEFDINVTRMFGKDMIVDHVHCQCVVFAWTGIILRASEKRRAERKQFVCFAGTTATKNSASALELAVVGWNSKS